MSRAVLAIRDARVANDNAYTTGKPVVRVPHGRAGATYARSENVILPLRFAQRMTGWQLGSGSSGDVSGKCSPGPR